MGHPEPYETIAVYTDDDGVMTLMLNRPRVYNAINTTMYEEIGRALDAAAADEEVHCVFMYGAGKYYSSGNDLAAMSKAAAEAEGEIDTGPAVITLRAFVKSFLRCDKPIVVAVNGPAIGIAVTTLGLCDFVVAADNATFETPFMRLGQGAEAASSLVFPMLMGAKAKMMLMAGRKITAAEAERWGLITEVKPQGPAFVKEVRKLATEIAKLPPIAMRECKRLINSHTRDQLEKANEAECQLLGKLWAGDECIEAVMEFMMRKMSKKSKM